MTEFVTFNASVGTLYKAIVFTKEDIENALEAASQGKQIKVRGIIAAGLSAEDNTQEMFILGEKTERGIPAAYVMDDSDFEENGPSSEQMSFAHMISIHSSELPYTIPEKHAIYLREIEVPVGAPNPG